MSSPIEICVLGPDRAGTTHFCSLFDSLPEVLTTRSKLLYEIFKQGCLTSKPELIPILKKKYGLTFKQLQYSKKLKQKPAKQKRIYTNLWKTQAKQQGQQFLLYKILHHQITLKELESFLLPDHRMIKIVITRNLLDMYISHRKAKKIKQWKHADTTKLKIAFNTKVKFDPWIKVRTDFFKGLKKLAQQKGYRLLVIDYQDLHSYPNDTAKLKYILQRIKDELGFDLISDTIETTPIQSLEINSPYKKQDLSNSYKDKVSNYTDMKLHLKDRNLELKNIFK